MELNMIVQDKLEKNWVYHLILLQNLLIKTQENLILKNIELVAEKQIEHLEFRFLKYNIIFNFLMKK